VTVRRKFYVYLFLFVFQWDIYFIACADNRSLSTWIQVSPVVHGQKNNNPGDGNFPGAPRQVTRTRLADERGTLKCTRLNYVTIIALMSTDLSLRKRPDDMDIKDALNFRRPA